MTGHYYLLSWCVFWLSNCMYFSEIDAILFGLFLWSVVIELSKLSTIGVQVFLF